MLNLTALIPENCCPRWRQIQIMSGRVQSGLSLLSTAKIPTFSVFILSMFSRRISFISLSTSSVPRNLTKAAIGTYKDDVIFKIVIDNFKRKLVSKSSRVGYSTPPPTPTHHLLPSTETIFSKKGNNSKQK